MDTESRKRLLAAIDSGEMRPDDLSPHAVFDGKWGGWGPVHWFRLQDLGADCCGFGARDVVERSKDEGGEWKWSRIWIDDVQAWRPITEEEASLLQGAGDQ